VLRKQAASIWRKEVAQSFAPAKKEKEYIPKRKGKHPKKKMYTSQECSFFSD